MNKVKFQGTVSGDGFGYVYVMSYPESSKVKIGHSLSPDIRASQIGGTLAPEQPVVEALFWCAERREDVERAAHKLEQAARYNGEWFTISINQAITAIQKAAEQVDVEVQLVTRPDNSEEMLEDDFEKPNCIYRRAMRPSPALAAVIGPGTLTRVEVVSKLWAYIKMHKLQDVTNKRMINCDANLIEVFGKAQVSMFEMSGLIDRNLR